MIAIGENNITKAYLGQTELTNIAIGDELLLSSGPLFDAEIEYLESTGTQYIDLPLTVAVGQYMEVGGEMICIYKNTGNYYIFSTNPSVQFRVNKYSNSTTNIIYATTIGNNGANGGMSFQIGVKTSWALSTTFKRIGETSTDLSRPLTAAINGFRLFGLYGGNASYPVKFCSFYIMVGQNKVYDFIPVRVGQKGYLYDKVSGTLFGNVGTGDFILGNDIT